MTREQNQVEPTFTRSTIAADRPALTAALARALIAKRRADKQTAGDGREEVGDKHNRL
ncbi:MAG: hypothetical protein ACLQNE_47085 [Thermoguttaceae bacterium]